MSPRWLIIEKLVTELGGVHNARDETRGRADPEPVDVDEVLLEATRAVTAVLTDPPPPIADPAEPDEVVRKAWEAIAVARERVGRLAEAIERSRRARAKAEELQDQSFRLRLGDRGRSN
jgi:hypothetical protein